MDDFESQIAHDDGLLSLYRYWSGKRRGRAMPSRADLEVAELKPWLGYLILVEVSGEPLDFRYRVFGSQIAEEVGFDLTGQSIDDNPPKEVAELRRGYEEAVARKAPFYQLHEMTGLKGRYRYHRVLLPLSDDDETVNMVLCLSYALGRPSKK
jgi:hypothetical protein